MQLSEVVAVSEGVRSTRSRNRKTALLAACLGELSQQEVGIAVSWLAGELPQGKIGVGFKTLQSTRPPPADHGSWTVLEVHQLLSSIQGQSGPGSQARRIEVISHLLGACTAAEQRFLALLMVGELRQGALDGVMVAAISEASGLGLDEVRRAFMLTGDLARVAVGALVTRDLSAFRMEVFTALRPMLAQTADSPTHALDLLGTALFDVKLDGVRVQVHRDGDEVQVFTRRLNEVSHMVPEVVELARSLPVKRLILDGEAIALRPDGSPHSFQTTMKRFGRRVKVAEMRQRLPLTLRCFDALLLNDDDLLDTPARERLGRLDELLPEAHRVRRFETSDAEAAEAFFSQILDEGHEGVMAKDPASPYEAGSRGRAWLKIKSAHHLDLVVLAAEWGSGRRKGWLSNLHLGAYDADNDAFVMLGKTFKGLTDAVLAWQTEALLAREVRRDGHVVVVRPELVVEIAFNDVQHSPHYPSGMALRFARVKRYRDDKRASEADTVHTVRALLPRA